MNYELGIRNEELGIRNEELGIRNEELGMRNEGGGFAANIYRTMSEGSIQVTSHLAPLIPSHASLLSNFRIQGLRFRVQGCGAAHKNIEASRRFETSVFSYRTPNP